MAQPTITLRVIKGEALTWTEGDANFSNLAAAAIPTGGTAGQTLIKNSNTDYDFVYGTPPVGYTGSAGPIGYTGSASTAIGYTGSAGADGAAGSTGYTGSAGADGAQGATGYTGSAGADGAQGAIGYTGSAGEIGYTGSASTVIGYTGSAGADGAAGATGYTGSSGTGGGVTINDSATTSTTETWSANKLYTTLGDIQAALTEIIG